MKLKNSLAHLHPANKLILVIFLTGIGTLLSFLLFYVLNLFYGHYSLIDLARIHIESPPALISMMRILQIMSHLGMFIFPSLALAYVISNSPLYEIDIKHFPKWGYLGIIFAITLLSMPLINLLSVWNYHLVLPEYFSGLDQWIHRKEAETERLINVMLQMGSVGDLLVNILMITVIPAIGEELFFRGIVQKQLSKWGSNTHMAIYFTAFLFSAFHLQFLGFIPRMMLGIIFGYLYYYSKNIWAPILSHFINNGIALLVFILYGTQIESQIEQSSLSLINWVISILCFAAAVFILIRTKNRSVPQ